MPLNSIPYAWLPCPHPHPTASCQSWGKKAVFVTWWCCHSLMSPLIGPGLMQAKTGLKPRCKIYLTLSHGALRPNTENWYQRSGSLSCYNWTVRAKMAKSGEVGERASHALSRVHCVRRPESGQASEDNKDSWELSSPHCYEIEK